MLLSRKLGMIEKAFTSLESDQQKAIMDHLMLMVVGTGWQPEQGISAQVALDTIADHQI